MQMNFDDWLAVMRKHLDDSKKYANPRKPMAYYVNIRYDKMNQEWSVTRYDDLGNKMEVERYHYKSNAKWIANQWMDNKGVTRIYVYKVNGKLDDVIFKGTQKCKVRQ